MRYIIAINPTTGERRPFTGLAPTDHKDLRDMAALKGFVDIVGAAFVHMGPACGVTIHGRSDGLNIGPGPDDAMLIHLHYRMTLDLLPEFKLRRAGDEPATCQKCEATGNADPLQFP